MQSDIYFSFFSLDHAIFKILNESQSKLWHNLSRIQSENVLKRCVIGRWHIKKIFFRNKNLLQIGTILLENYFHWLDILLTIYLATAFTESDIKHVWNKDISVTNLASYRRVVVNYPVKVKIGVLTFCTALYIKWQLFGVEIDWLLGK